MPDAEEREVRVCGKRAPEKWQTLTNQIERVFAPAETP
jgi:hypothetical protein